MAVKRVAHPSVDERTARGKEARTETPLSAPRRVGNRKGSPGPGRLARTAEHDARTRPGAGAARPHDGLPLRLLSRRRGHHGRGLCLATPQSGIHDGQLCGDAHLANFGGFASPERRSRLRHQRFRRDAARAHGMGRQAHGGELHDRCAQQRLHRRAMRDAVTQASARSYREAMAGFAQMRTMDIWYAHLSEDDFMAVGADRREVEARRPRPLQARGEERRRRRARATACRRSRSSPNRSTADTGS